MIWPKLFRRIVPYLAAGYTDFDGFDAWLRADPVKRDDTLFLLDRLEPGNMHDVIHGVGQQIQLTVWPEDFVVAPDPAPPGQGTRSRPYRAGDVLIVAALPDPTGTDPPNEKVTVLNVSDTDIDLQGWRLTDEACGRRDLTGVVTSGSTQQVQLGSGLVLGNRGDTILLNDNAGAVIDRVSYPHNKVRAGRTICFGRKR